MYVHHGLSFRYTHDLGELISGLEKGGISVPQDVKDAGVLTSYAWEARYPGLYDPVTEEEYREAVELAETVLAWAETRIGSRETSNMGKVTHELLSLISKQIQDHGIVVWYDPEGVYQNLMRGLSLPETTIFTYNGSFFELRWQLGPFLEFVDEEGKIKPNPRWLNWYWRAGDGVKIR